MKSHRPNKLPVEINYGRIAKLFANAQFSLGRLDGLHNNLKDPKLLIAPLITKEATVSSKIEGTQSTVRDVFLHEAGEETKFKDVVEVANYKKAMEYAIEELKERPLSINLIKELHGILLNQARGSGIRGDFRQDQVWIGKVGVSIEQATYIPPENALILEYMDNLEKYIHQDEEDILIQAALLHYQFEAIHPFNDGNGRIGRLLIPLFLHYKGKISLPILYLSGYFESNKDAYIDALHRVDTKADYDSWVEYFLTAVIEQANQTQDLIQKILALFEQVNQKTQNSKSPYMFRFIEFMFKRPIFTAPQAVQSLQADRSTVKRLQDELVNIGIVRELPLDQRKKVYIFGDLVRLL